LLAVADGTVVAVQPGQADPPPQTMLSGLRSDQLGGNTVTVDIGDGLYAFYAFYAHFAPSSTTVKVGDRVTRGQVLGQLGNSSEAHLHFQLQRSGAWTSAE